MKLICGPMATVSHPAFRILVEKFGGCDEYYTEMINAGTLITDGPFEKYYIDPSPVPDKVVWQLTGSKIENMLIAARQLVKLPGIGLDLNMGCSAPDIYRTGAGIGWMLKPIEETRELVHEIGKIIREEGTLVRNPAGEEKGTGDFSALTSESRETETLVRNPAARKRFSVKLRLGDDSFTDDGFLAFCDMLVSEGVELLTLHPRTKKEKLTRPARYEYCQLLCERYHKQGVQIYLNGNIKDRQSLEHALSKAPDVDGVMISRASVQKPWIFAELQQDLQRGQTSLQNSPQNLQRGQTSLQKIDMYQLALDYISDIEKYQPPEFWKTRLQRFFTYYSQNFLFSHYAQTQFLNAKDNEDLRARLADFFEKCPEEREHSTKV